MAKITSYNALVTYVKSLSSGDIFTVGPDDVSPQMITTLVKLTLAFPITVSSSSVDEQKNIITVIGIAKVFGIADMVSTLTFVPVTEDKLDGAFNMSLSSKPPAGTQWELVNGFAMADMAVNFEPNKEVEVYKAGIACDLILGTTDTVTLPIELGVPSYKDMDWVLTGEFSGQTLNLDTFSTLASGIKLSDYLPSPVNTLAKFSMREIELAFNPVQTQISYSYFVVEYADSWSILDIIHIPKGGVSFKFMMDFQEITNSYIELETMFTIAETVPIDVGAHFAPDNFFVWGRIQRGKSISITDLFTHFKVTLPKKFPEIDITTLSLLAEISNGRYSFDLEAQIDAGSSLQVENLTAKVSVDTQPKTKVDADFFGTIVIDQATSLFLEAKYDGGGGGLTLTGDAKEIPIGSIIAYFGSKFGIKNIPEPIKSLELKSLTTSYNTATGDFHFKCIGDFTIYETAVEVMFSVDITHTQEGDELLESVVVGDKGYSATFGGSVKFADLEFDIKFNTKNTGEKIFIADYIHTGNSSQVKLKDLIHSISSTLSKSIPDDISIGLDVIKFAFLENSEKVKHFLFGVELGAKIGLTDIPLIGDKLPEEITVEFDNLQFAYAKPKFNQAEAKQINALFPAGVTKIPDEGLQEGVLISSNLQLGTDNKTLSITIPTGGSDFIENTDVVYPLATTSDSAVGVSIDVQKQFGPIGIQKIGLEYKGERLYAIGDITLSAQILSIGLIGLGIGSKISSFDPAVTLDGLSITVAEGPLVISGGLYGSIDPLNFNGALMVEVPSMTIGALGGYAQLGSDPSFFMYLSVNRPIIGYPFFFLDGIAGGLGFNRGLNIPDIDGVANFPLVSWSTGHNPPGANSAGDIAKQVDKVLKALADDIPPQVGEYWIAAGINFSSFEILKSFALLTVAVGTDFKIALLGLTSASLPPDVGEGIPPICYVEMALKASFSPSTGILQVAAKLTPASYILSKDCNLTGGFAYYMWFKDNPDNDAKSYHAGDFVVTLGGYNPAYDKPAYFPSEPLLGLNWTVDRHTTIKGGIYFAMTPSTLMAGGRMEAVWQSGDLKAWFTAHADFLLSWKPFHYQASYGLTIGASYVLDLWVTTKTITVHVGVDVDLWGPTFGGKIYVDLTVISFTVKIGNQHNKKPAAISWNAFKDSFLPKSDSADFVLLQKPETPVETETYCLSAVSKGMLKDLDGAKVAKTDPDWVVNAETLELVTNSAIPIKEATLITADDKEESLPVGKTDFGVGPVNVNINNFISEHTITINRMVGDKPDNAYDVAKHINIQPITAYLPSGTWGGKLVVNPSISTVNKTPQNIGDLVVGYSITTKALTPDHTPLPIDISILQQESEGTVHFEWATPDIPTTDPFDQNKSMEIFMQTLNSASSMRSEIIQVLNSNKLDVNPDVNIEALAQSANTVLLSAPVLSYLGEERAA